MAKYRKKPVEIDAIQWTGENQREMFDFLTNGEKKDEYMTSFGETFRIDHFAIKGGLIIKTSEMPNTVLTAFYAGLLENNAVMNEKEAGKLLKQYFKEHAGDETATFPGFFNFIKECMEDDGFFKLSGLDKMIENQAKAMAEEAPEETAKSGSEKTKQTKEKSTSAK